VAKRKKEKTETKRTSFKFGLPHRGRKGDSRALRFLIIVLEMAAVVCFFIAAGVGLVLLEKKYVKKAVPVSKKTAVLKLIDVPVWVNEPLQEKIYTASKANGEDLKLDEEVAKSVQRNIKKNVAWVDKIKVQATEDSLLIKAEWRKPIAMFESGEEQFYVDANGVVLDFVPVQGLIIPQIKGLSGVKPSPGRALKTDDLAAAVAILTRLERMDKLVAPDKPLLGEIAAIDVSNFDGRKNVRSPHIVLYAKDDTEIIWGAEIGAWQRCMDATDEEKLAKLYGYYKERGTLMNDVKYINLRDPQKTIPQPIDKY